MANILDKWVGKIEYDGVVYDNIGECIKAVGTISGPFCVKLIPNRKETVNTTKTANKVVTNSTEKQYRITVKPYMTKQSEHGFDFMEKWNNNNPMPLRTMVGTVEKETRGMLYMKLHGRGEPTITCLRCGRELTNPISRHYGIGPECMSKIGLVADISDVSTITKQLTDITWEGWVIRSSIIEQEEV